MRIKLREASLEDLETLLHWDKQDHVTASDPNDDWNWDVELARNPEWREQLIADLDGKPLGFIQIIDPKLEDSKYWGDVPSNLRAIDIWIGERKNLRKGYGTIIMNLALEKCFANKDVTAVIIDPLEVNAGALKFYERLGFQFVEKRTFGQDACLVYQLKRKDWHGAAETNS